MPRPYQFAALSDAHVVGVLHHVRAAIVRDGRDGLAHVDALLWQYGVDPETLPIPRKVPKHFKRGELRRGILDALREGPLTVGEIAARVGDGLTVSQARTRVRYALCMMKAAGMVEKDGEVWRLVGRG